MNNVDMSETIADESVMVVAVTVQGFHMQSACRISIPTTLEAFEGAMDALSQEMLKQAFPDEYRARMYAKLGLA